MRTSLIAYYILLFFKSLIRKKPYDGMSHIVYKKHIDEAVKEGRIINHTLNIHDDIHLNRKESI